MGAAPNGSAAVRHDQQVAPRASVRPAGRQKVLFARVMMNVLNVMVGALVLAVLSAVTLVGDPTISARTAPSARIP
jgi:hypothetical protein